jgi:Spy/CpxP family protein refolding chaperone
MTRRVYVYFALTFLLGLIAGSAGAFFYAWNSGHWRRGGFDAKRVVTHLKQELNLNDQQAQQVTEILVDAGKKYADLQKQVEPQFTAIREETRTRIRQILTPDQVTKFNELVRRVDERRKGRKR